MIVGDPDMVDPGGEVPEEGVATGLALAEGRVPRGVKPLVGGEGAGWTGQDGPARMPHSPSELGGGLLTLHPPPPQPRPERGRGTDFCNTRCAFQRTAVRIKVGFFATNGGRFGPARIAPLFVLNHRSMGSLCWKKAVGTPLATGLDPLPHTGRGRGCSERVRLTGRGEGF